MSRRTACTVLEQVQRETTMHTCSDPATEAARPSRLGSSGGCGTAWHWPRSSSMRPNRAARSGGSPCPASSLQLAPARIALACWRTPSTACTVHACQHCSCKLSGSLDFLRLQGDAGCCKLLQCLLVCLALPLCLPSSCVNTTAGLHKLSAAVSPAAHTSGRVSGQSMQLALQPCAGLAHNSAGALPAECTVPELRQGC